MKLIPIETRRRRASGAAVRRAVVCVLFAAPMLAQNAGCSVTRKPAVPADLADQASIEGMGSVRSWSDELNPAFMEEVKLAVAREIEELRAAGHTGALPPTNFLAISGGGANGAYGAGLLCGWSETGTRPEFKLVTGISTGALTAPFAYLGPEYDAQLKEVYTRVRTNDILKARNMLAGLLGDALADTKPLWRLLRKLVDQRMMEAIAAQHKRGRLLIIGTTNLDAQRGVVWNIGAIAASGHPKSLDLIQNILIASASIPAAFPPVMIDVEAGGKRYQEMHVDGGAISQVFVYPPSLNLAEAGPVRQRTVYVIRNSRLDPNWTEVRRRTLSIASRAIDSLIQTQGFGDLYRIYLTSQRDGVDFNLAYIPETFKEKNAEAFDPVYMSKLFDVGYQSAREGNPWFKAPPGYAMNHGAASVK